MHNQMCEDSSLWDMKPYCGCLHFRAQTVWTGWHISNYLPVNTVSYPRKRKFLVTLPRKPSVSQPNIWFPISKVSYKCNFNTQNYSIALIFTIFLLVCSIRTCESSSWKLFCIQTIRTFLWIILPNWQRTRTSRIFRDKFTTKTRQILKQHIRCSAIIQ